MSELVNRCQNCGLSEAQRDAALGSADALATALRDVLPYVADWDRIEGGAENSRFRARWTECLDRAGAALAVFDAARNPKGAQE